METPPQDVTNLTHHATSPTPNTASSALHLASSNESEANASPAEDGSTHDVTSSIQMTGSAQGMASSVRAGESPTAASDSPSPTACPVCRDDYTEPKVLPCAHRFCRQCLITWFESTNGSPSCPICKRQIGEDGKRLPYKEKSPRYKPQGNKGAAATQSPTVQTESSKTRADNEPNKSSAVQANTLKTASNTSATAGNTSATAGNTSATAGNTSATAGNTPATASNTSATAGNKSATAGNTSSTASNTSATAGNTAGNTATAGNTSSTASNTSATAGNTAGRTSAELVDTLPTDTVLAALVDSTKKLRPPHVCNVCPQTAHHAQDLCLHCGDMMCQACSRFHAHLGATQGHQVRHVDDLSPEQLASSAREMCSTHAGQLLELYCPAHGHPLCLLCFAVGHTQCGGVQTVADAATRQRQVVHSQMQKLDEARSALDSTSVDIQHRQQELSASQQQVLQDISTLSQRITSAVRARCDQLTQRAQQTPIPLAGKLQQQKEEVDESRWLVSANHQLVSDSLRWASDVNLLRVSDPLAARAACLAADVTSPARVLAKQREALTVDQYDVLRIEELVRDLGAVSITDTATDGGRKPLLPPPQQASSGAKKRSEFDPFVCIPRHIDYIGVPGHHWLDIVCRADDNTLLVYKDKSVFSVCTSRPFNKKKVVNLLCVARAMANLQDGLVVMTTEVASLLFIDVTTAPATTTTVRVAKVYWGVSRGAEDTIIVSPASTPSTLDIITRDGTLLRTLRLAHSVNPRHLCRVRDYVIACDPGRKTVLKVGIETGKTEVLSHDGLTEPGELFVDHRDRLYIANTYSFVFVTDLNGKWKRLGLLNHGGLVVTPGGWAFSGHPSPGGNVSMSVSDLTKH